jgi:hypothetical protein
MIEEFDDGLIDMGGGIKLNKLYASPGHCPKCGSGRGVLYENPGFTDAYTCQSYMMYYYGEIKLIQSNQCKNNERLHLILDIESKEIIDPDIRALIEKTLKYLKEV